MTSVRLGKEEWREGGGDEWLLRRERDGDECL